MIPIGDDDSGRLTKPYVTYLLIAINVLAFLFEITRPTEAALQTFFTKWAVVPLEYAKHTDLPPQIPFPFWSTLFTSMFLHGGWMHLIGNMLFLWVFGDNIEDRWGHLRYLIIYLVCGVAASLTHIFFNLNSTLPSLGASGAISGILGAYLVLFPKNRIRVLSRVGVVQVPAIVMLGFWILIQFISQIAEMGRTAQSSGVAYWAHIGGFLTGIIFAFFFGRRSANVRPAV